MIDKELAAAKQYFGITTLRVYLHNIPYDAEKETCLERIATPVSLAETEAVHRYTTGEVRALLFDDFQDQDVPSSVVPPGWKKYGPKHQHPGASFPARSIRPATGASRMPGGRCHIRQRTTPRRVPSWSYFLVSRRSYVPRVSLCPVLHLNVADITQHNFHASVDRFQFFRFPAELWNATGTSGRSFVSTTGMRRPARV